MSIQRIKYRQKSEICISFKHSQQVHPCVRLRAKVLMWRWAGKGACRVKFETCPFPEEEMAPTCMGYHGAMIVCDVCLLIWRHWWCREPQMLFSWMLLVSPSSCLPTSCSPASRSCSLVLQVCQSSSCWVVFLLLHQSCRSNFCFLALFLEIFSSPHLNVHQNWLLLNTWFLAF